MAREQSKRIKIRLENLEKAIAIAGGSAAKLSKKCDISPSEISQMRNPDHQRNVGDVAAEKIESGLGLEFGWMDKDHDNQQAIHETTDIDISSLIPMASPNTHRVLEKMQTALETGQLTDEDLIALEAIAERLINAKKDE